MEEDKIKMYGFRLNTLEQNIYDNYLIDNNLSNTKELINRLVLDAVKQEAYENIQQLKQLKESK